MPSFLSVKPTPLIKFNFKHLYHPSWIMGVLLACIQPIPGPPFYEFAFIAFLFGFRQVFIPRTTYTYIYIGAIIVSITLGLLSNFASPYFSKIEFGSAFFSLFYYLFFFAAFFILDINIFLKGYILIIRCLAVFLIFLYFFLGIYKQGTLTFIFPEKRIWAKFIFNDFPNFMCFGISVGFLISSIYQKKKLWSVIILIAAIITTSRLAILAAFIFLIYYFINNPKKIVYVFIVLVPFLFYYGSKIESLTTEYHSLASRIAKTKDREKLYGKLIGGILEEPLIGNGSLRPSSILYNVSSYHNSYLEVLFRFGFVSIIFYLLLILPYPQILPLIRSPAVYIILFFLLSSFTQNILKHPHYGLLYVIILFNYKKINLYLTPQSELNA